MKEIDWKTNYWIRELGLTNKDTMNYEEFLSMLEREPNIYKNFFGTEYPGWKKIIGSCYMGTFFVKNNSEVAVNTTNSSCNGRAVEIGKFDNHKYYWGQNLKRFESVEEDLRFTLWLINNYTINEIPEPTHPRKISLGGWTFRKKYFL